MPDREGAVVLDFLAGGGVVALGYVTKPDFGEVRELGHRAHGGARRLDRIGLLDRDRRANILDRVDLGLVEQVEELAGVRAERLDVASLPLGVERVKDERGLAGAAQAGDHDIAAERHIEVEALEIVLPDPAQADAFGFGGRGRGGRHHAPTK